MPSTTIEVRHPYTDEEEVAIIDAIQAALVEALRLPEWDRNVRLIVHAPHRFAAPSNRAQPDRYTVVTIDLFAGRSLDAKHTLYRGIVERLRPFGIPIDHVVILLREIPRSDWGIRGGQPASDLELGFDVEV